MAATLMALQSLAAHMQVVVITDISLLFYLAYFVWVGPSASVERRGFFFGVSVALLLGVVGGLPQTLPMLEVANWSGYAGFQAGFYWTGYLKIGHLLGFMGPWILGNRWGASTPGGYLGLTEHGIFYGVTSLIVGTVGVAFMVAQRIHPHQPGDKNADSAKRAMTEEDPPRASSICPLTEVKFWLILLTVNLLLMLGDNGLLRKLFAYLPVYNFFHVPARHSLVVGLCVAWLAAFGLDRLHETEKALQRLLMKLVVRTCLVVMLLAPIVV